MWAKIITIKRTKDLNYFSLCALNLFNTRVSQFELNYWNKFIEMHLYVFAYLSDVFKYVFRTVNQLKYAIN